MVVVVAVILAGCGDDDDSSVPASTTTVPATTTVAVTPTTTPSERADCNEQDAFAVADEVIETARLAPGGEWSTDTTANSFDEQTQSGGWLLDELGLDCGVKASQTTADGDERLLLAAWTGPRIAFVIQASDQPSSPYVPTDILFIVTQEPFGEFLAEDRSLWAGRLEDGETPIVGHRDYNLGVVAKAWQTIVGPLGEAEPTLDSERHAIDALEAAGMRKVAIAQPAEFGSDEGTIMFISPTGLISVADVAPAGTFDPLQPRYFTGATTTVMVDGVEVRVTEAAEGEQCARTAVALGRPNRRSSSRRLVEWGGAR